MFQDGLIYNVFSFGIVVPSLVFLLDVCNSKYVCNFMISSLVFPPFLDLFCPIFKEDEEIVLSRQRLLHIPSQYTRRKGESLDLPTNQCRNEVLHKQSFKFYMTSLLIVTEIYDI